MDRASKIGGNFQEMGEKRVFLSPARKIPQVPDVARLDGFPRAHTYCRFSAKSPSQCSQNCRHSDRLGRCKLALWRENLPQMSSFCIDARDIRPHFMQIPPNFGGADSSGNLIEFSSTESVGNAWGKPIERVLGFPPGAIARNPEELDADGYVLIEIVSDTFSLRDR